MIHSGTKRFIIHTSLWALAGSAFVSFWFASSSIKHEQTLQLGSLNRQLETFNSGLKQLAAFLAEPGDLGDDQHIVRRLNRFIYSNAGISGIELRTNKTVFHNSHDADGQYLNGGVSLPGCGSDDVITSSSLQQQLRSCEDGSLAIERRFEDFEGNPLLLKLVLKLDALPGGTVAHAKSGFSSSQLNCTYADQLGSPCEVEGVVMSSREFLLKAAPCFGVVLFLMAICALLFFRLVVMPTRTLNRMILQNGNAESQESANGLARLGILRLFREPVAAITALVREKLLLESKHAANVARERIADEVVHNIRSPLAALHGVEPDLGSIPEEARVVFRSAVTRIEDIANLLDHNLAKSPGTKTQTYLASSLINVLLSEKRRQFLNRPGLEFLLHDDGSSYGVFVQVENTSFKTVLSNLINNAVEALPPQRDGKITVSLRAVNDQVCEVLVSDNGIGMTPEVLARATTEGFTYGKSQGKGLGLFHAKSELEAWCGSLTVRSEPGNGTEVRLTLPRALPPPWFLPRLELINGARVAILDDDPSIHLLWRNRIGGFVRLQHFHGGAELRQAVAQGEQFALFLADYELIGEEENGLELALEMGLASHTVLVTSRFEDAQVRSSCESAHIKLLPKGLAGQVPVVSANSPTIDTSNLDVIFLDDDALMRQTWQRAAYRVGLTLGVFESPQTLFSRTAMLSREIPIYVDFNLGSEVNGLQVCERLHAEGFRHLHLATGATINDAPSWLRKVGKTPPFGRAIIQWQDMQLSDVPE